MDESEIILNLWYVMDDDGLIYSLRARCYVTSGTDEDKLALLRRFAATDYLIAQPFPIPERLHTTFHEGDVQRKMPVVGFDSLVVLGGPEALFEEVFVRLEERLPATTKLSIAKSPLVVITPLIADEKNDLHPQVAKRVRIGS